MPRWVSDRGTWYPAKERIALKNLSGKVKLVDGKEVQPGDDYIYEGPDRSALFELFDLKVETLGQDFRKNPEFLQAVRNQGFQDVSKFLEAYGYDDEKVKKEFEEKYSATHKDEIPKRVKAIETMGGGVDTAGVSKAKLGGFGPQPDLK